MSQPFFASKRSSGGVRFPHQDKPKARRVDNRLAAELGVKPLGESELVQALKVGAGPQWEMAGKWLGAGNGGNGEHFLEKRSITDTCEL